MKNLIVKFFNGEITLWKSYWLVGELLNALIILIIFNIEINLFKNKFLGVNLPFFEINNFSFLSKIFIIFWSIFITIGIWRSAEKYKGHFFWIIITLTILSYRLFSFKILLI